MRKRLCEEPHTPAKAGLFKSLGDVTPIPSGGRDEGRLGKVTRIARSNAMPSYGAPPRGCLFNLAKWTEPRQRLRPGYTRS